MDSLFAIAQQSDAEFQRMMNTYHRKQDDSQAALESRIEYLKDEYLEEDDQVWDVLIDEAWAGDVQSVVRAMVNAHMLGNHDSWECFAKSLTQSIIDGVDKKARFMAEKGKA